jgi:hypothetical protein
LLWWLGIGYSFLFVCELEAYWIPYLFLPQPSRAARYQAMFGGTHAFLPVRNGIKPNALHVTPHILKLTTLVLSAALLAQEGRLKF